MQELDGILASAVVAQAIYVQKHNNSCIPQQQSAKVQKKIKFNLNYIKNSKKCNNYMGFQRMQLQYRQDK